MTELYACYNKDDGVRAKSSSGGIYFLLAQEVLRKGGDVFAACYEGLKVKHKKIEDESMLMSSLGSKYIPSEIGDTFAAVRKEITNDRIVLFVGLPCQCSGLISFINECANEAKEKLILIDLVCHGIPAHKAWDGYCESLKNNGFDLSEVNMRDKSTGWKNYSWLLKDSKGNKQLDSHSTSTYMKGFVSNLYLRPSCSNCQFKGVERETDITLGDYWGIQSIQPEMDDDKGTSLVFIHSKKGKALFEAIGSDIVSKQAPWEEAVKYNPSIISPSFPSEKREEFFGQLAEGEDFDHIVEEMTRKPLITRMKRKLKNIIKPDL